MLYKNLNKLLNKPELYEEMKTAFWDDSHISGQMLKAHIDPDFEGASRKLEFIAKSVSWICDILSPAVCPGLLDLGCGPGIYAEKFAMAGYRVTGVDFSKRSIEYAKESARDKELDIAYFYENYLDLSLDRQFDLCTMIYCDYGALSDKNRRRVLERAHCHLKQGGKFLLDVFSMAKYHQFEESRTWEHCPDGGFWCEGAYTVLNGNYRFTDHVSLEQVTVLAETVSNSYYLWNTYFTRDSLAREAQDAGFSVCGWFGDVAGAPYTEESLTIAVLLEKQ